MSANVTWENDERTVLRLTVSGRWQWSELHAAKVQIEAMLDVLDHPVSILACGELDHWLPLGFNENMTELTHHIHPNVHQVIIVYDNALFQQLFLLFARLFGGFPYEFFFVRTLEEAQTYLTAPAPA